MDPKFEAILNSLPAKEPRSRLEPYSELITEMRKRGHSYREITQVLKKACGLEVGTSTINDFVLARSKSKMKSSGLGSRTIETKKDKRALTGTYRNTKAQESTRRPQKELEGIAKTIKELKDRPLKTRAKKLLFEYNPDEPLRLHEKKSTRRPQKELEGIAKTIKELKDGPLKTRAKKLLFEYNPDEPLRLQRNQRTKE